MIRLIVSLIMAVTFAAYAADPAKVLRIASPDIETLDPHAYTDDPSFQVIQAIFEPAFEWDYLASPPKLTPLTAAAPVEITTVEPSFQCCLSAVYLSIEISFGAVGAWPAT